MMNYTFKYTFISLLASLGFLLPPSLLANEFPRLINNASNVTVTGGLGDNCLEVITFDVKALDESDTPFSPPTIHTSWKTEITNHCSLTIKAFIEYQLLSLEGIRLARGLTSVFIPRNVENYIVTGPGSVLSENENLVTHSNISVEGEKYLLTPIALFCLSAELKSPLVLAVHLPRPGGFFSRDYGIVEQSIGIDVQNECNFDLFTQMEFVAHDIDGFYLWGTTKGVYVPPDGAGKSRFISSARDNRFTITSNYTVRPVFAEFTSRLDLFYSNTSRWIESLVPDYDELRGSVRLEGAVAHIGDYSYELHSVKEGDSPRFRIDSSTFRKLNSRPRISADYSAIDSKIHIPVLKSDNEIIAVNIELRIVDPELLTFELLSFEEPKTPSVYLDSTAEQCIRIDSTSSTEETLADQLVSYDVAMEVTNLCNFSQTLRLRHRLLNQNDMLINRRSIGNIVLPGQQSRIFSLEYSVDLDELADSPAREEFIVAIGYAFLSVSD